MLVSYNFNIDFTEETVSFVYNIENIDRKKYEILNISKNIH